MHVRVLLSRYRAYTTCPSCNGGRFQLEALNYKMSAKSAMLALSQLAALSISQARDFLGNIDISPNDSTAKMLRSEICARLNYLSEVGVGYLTLDRSTRTLSGGEVQRVNLTTCLGASLVNTLFIMDEPSVGLHPRDVGRLVRVMHNLRDKGNTLLVVEHEERIIRAADNLIDVGPGRGERGGELIWNGPLDDFVGQAPRLPNARTASDALALQRFPASLTRDYLSGQKSIPIPKSRRKATSFIKIVGASQHNLKNIDVDLPLGIFTCVTGVSGSGKSTLIHDVLYRNLLRAKGQSSDQEAGACKSVTGAHRIDEVVMVDQAPLARTPRSTPILYLGLYDRTRELFAAQPEAMAQGLTASSFSFNSGSGRCERCSGTGFEKIEMQFLSDLYVRCAECEGRRFQPHVLNVKLHDKSIHDVLELTVSEAIQFFVQIGEQKTLSKPLDVLDEVGLGYLRLGQPLNTLSGGESQRLKLVRHLAETGNRSPSRTGGSETGKNGEDDEHRNLFIFDEPTTGLQFDDVAGLLQVFHRMVARGNSIIVIEHNLEVIKSADWIVDLGPEAGDEGGDVVGVGTPEQIAKIDHSHTGRFLQKILSSARATSRSSAGRLTYTNVDEEELARAAETAPRFRIKGGNGAIGIHGAREHNLKNIDVDIPRDRMVVVTGLSGSGKSTLAFDILFAEGQRRFLDSMSA